MPRFQTVVRRARFTYSPYTAQEMQGFAQLLADTIRARIQRGHNIYDQPAAPLKLSTMKQKAADPNTQGNPSLRDWTWTGFTLRCLKVLMANQNRALIGFLDEPHPYKDRRGKSHIDVKRPLASQVAYYNNLRERQWGVSPHDRQVVTMAMANYRPVVTLDEITQAGAVSNASGQYYSGMRQFGFGQYMNSIPKVA